MFYSLTIRELEVDVLQILIINRHLNYNCKHDTITITRYNIINIRHKHINKNNSQFHFWLN